jgi:phosphomannomutase/phosphoglucomutase
MLFAKEILAHTKGALVLYDVKCSSYLESVIKKNGGEPLMWKTGHSFIKNKMQETGALLAGEMSGHLFFKDRWYGFDDAIYAGARLLEILSQQDQAVSDVFNALPNSINTPELQIPMHDEGKFDFMKKLLDGANFPGGKITTIDGLRVDFNYGWGLIRPSNTSPNLILRFEAEDKQGLQKIQEMFRSHLLAIDSALSIPF